MKGEEKIIIKKKRKENSIKTWTYFEHAILHIKTHIRAIIMISMKLKRFTLHNSVCCVVIFIPQLSLYRISVALRTAMSLHPDPVYTT